MVLIVLIESSGSTLHDGLCNTPLGRFSMLDISVAVYIDSINSITSWNSIGAQKFGVGNLSLRRRIVREWRTLLLAEQSTLENRLRCV